MILSLAVIPALANASKPSVISLVAIPNLLDICIAFAPMSLPLNCLPLIASTLAVACSKAIACFVACENAATAAVPNPTLTVSAFVKYSEVLKAKLPITFCMVPDMPIISAVDSMIPLVLILKT